MGAKSNHFCPFQPILVFLSPDLLMECQISISIIDISANLKKKKIDIDKAILKNIDIDIDIDKGILQNIDIDIDKAILKNIDIDQEILENIDVDKILNGLEFGISKRAN